MADEHNRFERALRFAASVAEVATVERYLDLTLAGLADLVPADLWAFNDVGMWSKDLRALVYPKDGAEPRHFEAVARVLSDHPIIAEVERSGDGSPRRISDLWDRDRYRASRLYRNAYADMGVEHQVAFALVDGRHAVAVGFAANRSDRDFDDGEVELLRLVRPALRAAWRRVHAVSALAAAVESGSGCALVLVDERDVLRAGDHDAMELIAATGMRVVVGEPTPEPLCSSLDLISRHTDQPRTLGTGDAQVEVRVIAGGPGACRLLSISRVQGASALLTAREDAILDAIADGAANIEVARQLGISVRTVQKHLQRIYGKLGVTNRTAAVRARRR